MTNFDRFFIYRAPRAKIRRLKALYRLKSKESFIDTQGFLNKFAAHKSNYLVGFITDPGTALFLLVWEVFVLRTNPLAITGAFVGGVLSWTLLEYIFHRFVYHKGNTLAHKGHLMHHESPKLLLGMPWFITSGVFWLLWYVLAVRLELQLVISVFSGLMIGYFIYCTFHHSLRDVNFGVTNRFWDRVFGTTYRKETYKPKTVPRDARAVARP